MEKDKVLTEKDLPYLRKTVKLDDGKTYKSFKKKRVKANCMTKKEERKFFGHGFGPLKKASLVVNNGDITLFFDKLKRLCDILPRNEENNQQLSMERGVQYEEYI